MIYKKLSNKNLDFILNRTSKELEDFYRCIKVKAPFKIQETGSALQKKIYLEKHTNKQTNKQVNKQSNKQTKCAPAINHHNTET